jgi:hypothetical protein
MGILNWLRKKKENDSRFKEIDKESKLHEKLEQRKLSANERELNKYMQEDREKKITKEVERLRKKRSDEFFHKDIIKQPNVMTGHKNILHTKSMLKNNVRFLYGR